MLSFILLLLCFVLTSSYFAHDPFRFKIISSTSCYSQKPRRNLTPSTPRRKPQFTKKKFDSPRHEIAQGKVARLIEDSLMEIINCGKIRSAIMPDSFLLSSVSIDDIELNNDFSIADVFVSCYGNAVERREVYVWLCHNVAQIQYQLAQRLRFLKHVPEIVFQLVDYQEEAFLEQAFDEITKETTEDENDDPVWPSIEYDEAQ